MTQPVEKPLNITLTIQTLNKITNYLSQKPYSEVVLLLQEIVNELSTQNLNLQVTDPKTVKEEVKDLSN